MTEVFQWPKFISKKWPKCLSKQTQLGVNFKGNLLIMKCIKAVSSSSITHLQLLQKAHPHKYNWNWSSSNLIVMKHLKAKYNSVGTAECWVCALHSWHNAPAAHPSCSDALIVQQHIPVWTTALFDEARQNITHGSSYWWTPLLNPEGFLSLTTNIDEVSSRLSFNVFSQDICFSLKDIIFGCCPVDFCFSWMDKTVKLTTG